MKTISIKQPWASLIVEGIKDIENRTWPTKFRGRVLVHSSATNLLNRCKFYDDILSTMQIRDVCIKGKETAIFGCHLDTSAIIGSVEIVDCVINHESIWAEHSTSKFQKISGNYKTIPVYNWVLANPIKFPEPIPAKGKLSFWDYPNILAEREEKGGALFCHCALPVKETNQVTGDYRFGYYCRYCGGKWYK